MRETEHVRICSERIDSVLRNPSASVLWNGDGRSPLHLGMEQFDVLVPAHGNPFEFDIDDTFVRRAAADPRDLYDVEDGENIVEKKKDRKLKVDISTIRRESKKRKRTEEQPESPDTVMSSISSV